MNTDNFEERIKGAFERHHPETDTDAIWENIEPRLKKKKKRRFIIFFFWGLGLGLLLLLFRYGATQRNGTQAAEAVPADKHAPAPAPAAAPTAVEKETADLSAAKGTDVSAETAAAATTRPLPHQIAPATSRSLPVPSYTANKAAPAGTPALANTGTSDVPSRSAVASADELEGSKGVATAETVVPDPVAVEKTAAPAQVAGVSPVLQEKTPETGTNQPLAAADQTTGLVSDGSGDSGDENNAAEKFKKKGKHKKSGKKKKDSAPKEKKPGKGKSAMRKPKLEHNIGIQAGPALALKQLRGGGGGWEPTGHLAGRKATEKTMESYTAGMFYSIATRKGLVIKTGLDYRQINEKFFLSYSEKKTEQINGVVAVTVDQFGNTVGQTMGVKTVTTTTIYSNTAYNNFRFINVPIGAGYRHEAQKSRWEITGGLDFNLYFSAVGTIYNLNNTPAAIGTGGSGSAFRRNTGTGLWLSYAYDRKWTEHLRWQVAANFQMPLKPVSGRDYALVQRYYNIGLQAGLLYQFAQKKKTAKKGK